MNNVKLPPLPPCDVGLAGQVKFAHGDDAMREYGIACARAMQEAAAEVAGDMDYGMGDIAKCIRALSVKPD